MSDRQPPGITPTPALRCSNPACNTLLDGSAKQCMTCGALASGLLLSGRFRIEALLGRGGMGAVYRAADLTLGRPVALKALAPGIGTVGGIPEEIRARFFREARVAAQLDHPNIVPVLHFESDGPFIYLVMPLLTGGTLAQRVSQRRPIEPKIALGWLRQVAAALDYAHQRPQPIIHRDVKPSNLLFHEDGRLCLADFGIARVLSDTGSGESAEITRTGVVLGSLHYMAPEQISGHPLPASDQYSVGVVLYELLTGTLPFDSAENYALMMQHLSVMPMSPGELIQGLPPGLNAVVLRALAKAPVDRFPSVGALAAAFEAALTGAPTVQVQAPAAPRLTRPVAPRPSVTMMHDDPGGEKPTQAATVMRPAVGWPPAGDRPGFGGRPPFAPQPSHRTRNTLIAVISAVVAVLLLCVLGLTVLSRLDQTARNRISATQTSQLATPTATQNPGNDYTQTLLAAEQHPPTFQDPLLKNSHHSAWTLSTKSVQFNSTGLLLPGVSEGGYIARADNTTYSAASRLQRLGSSFDVEVDLSYRGSSAAFGFGFFPVTRDSGPVVVLDSSGDYTIFKAVLGSDNSTTLAQGSNPGLALEQGQTYRLAVLVQGNQVALFLNGQFVTAILLNNDSFSQSEIFSLINFASQNQPGGDVTFKNLTIYPV